jgi:hypothetical protein
VTRLEEVMNLSRRVCTSSTVQYVVEEGDPIPWTLTSNQILDKLNQIHHLARSSIAEDITLKNTINNAIQSRFKGAHVS